MKQNRLILCRSQSEALYLSRRLTACGINGRLTRPPRSSNVRSCSWAIEIDSRSAMQAEACFRRFDVSPDTWRWEDGK